MRLIGPWQTAVLCIPQAKKMAADRCTEQGSCYSFYMSCSPVCTCGAISGRPLSLPTLECTTFITVNRHASDCQAKLDPPLGSIWPKTKQSNIASRSSRGCWLLFTRCNDDQPSEFERYVQQCMAHSHKIDMRTKYTNDTNTSSTMSYLAHMLPCCCLTAKARSC